MLIAGSAFHKRTPTCGNDSGTIIGESEVARLGSNPVRVVSFVYTVVTETI